MVGSLLERVTGNVRAWDAAIILLLLGEQNMVWLTMEHYFDESMEYAISYD
jgi:hypothetical protein